MSGAVQRGRRWLALLMVTGGVVLLFAPPGLAQGDVRTESDLFGYDLRAESTPVTVRIFEDFIPIPTDPGDPQFELTTSYTQARLGTGPIARAVASSVWPGPALGDGFGTVIGDESQTYPVRAAAQYPGSGEDDWDSSQTVDGFDDVGMQASARGLDVRARADAAGLPGPAQALAEPSGVSSLSEVTVRDGSAVATASSTLSALSLLDGTIVLEDVRTRMTATSDGTTPTTRGTTSVGAITVLGQRVALTDSGLQVVADEDDGDDGDDGTGDVGELVDPVNQVVQRLTEDLVADGVEETLGIHVEALGQEETIDGVIGERRAGGVRITVDLQVLRDYLDPLVGLLPIDEALDALPDDLRELQGFVRELLGLGPTLEVVAGRGLVAASASPPFEFEAPPPPPPPPAPPPPPTSSGTTTVPGGGITVSPPTGSAVQPPSAQVAPRQAAPPPAVAVAEPLDRFAGIPSALAALALFLTALPTYGLTVLREGAVGASASLEPPRTLPDLRGGA